MPFLFIYDTIVQNVIQVLHKHINVNFLMAWTLLKVFEVPLQ